VLIGSKRKELGQPDDDETAMKAVDVDDGPVILDEAGRLTSEEKASVMIDLRPTTQAIDTTATPPDLTDRNLVFGAPACT
jgi:hypothetical protein